MRTRAAFLGVLALSAVFLAWRHHARTSLGAAEPPFRRSGATQDLLCGLARASDRGADAAAGCWCGDAAGAGSCGHVALGNDRRRALLLAPGATLRVPVESGQAAALRFSVALSGGDGPVALTTTARGGDGAVVGSWHRELGPATTWLDAGFALPAPNQSLTLEIEIGAARDAATKVALANPRLVTPTSDGEAGPSNVVVYLIDTLRADHTSAYAYTRDTTPRLRRLAQQGIRFDQAYSTAARTRPATASVLTGLYPRFHGAHSGLALSPQVSTLAERFQAAGWSTWAFVTNGHVFGQGLNFEQGFDRFQAIPGTRQLHHARTEEVNEVLFPHLDAFADEPFLLYVHALDPHAPYDPPPGYRGRFTDAGYDGPIVPEKTVTADLTRVDVQERDLAQVVGLYDEDILYQDAMFGALLDRLDALGVLERTIIVVVSDHGEEFREHGSWAHGGRLFEEQTRVPLVVRVPGAPALTGRTVAAPVQIVDVMPTLLAWFGLEGGADCQGSDLTSLVRGEAASDLERPVVAEETTYTAGLELKSIRIGSWKMIRTGVGTELEEYNMLFDLAADPGEQLNVARAQRRRLWEISKQLDAREADWGKRFRVAQGAREQLDERTRKQLEALGYLMN